MQRLLTKLTPNARNRELVLLAAIGALALALRFYQLAGKSLWLDEAVQARSAHLNTLEEVLAQVYVDVNQMPLPYVVTWLLRPWGDSEFILRLPAVVEGTLMVLAVYVLAKALFGTRSGLVAALLSAIFPFAVWYSQEARSYALFMLLTTVQVYCAYTAVKRGRLVDWLALAALTTLNLYAHYLAFFPTAAIAVYVGFFLLAKLLRGSTARVKVAVVSMLVLITIVGAYVPWRALLREARLHTSLSAAIAVVTLGLVILGAFVFWSKLSIVLGSEPHAGRQIMLAAVAGVLVVAAYVPWLPQLRTLLSRPDTFVARLRLDHSPGVGDVVGLLDRLGLSGFVLAVFCLGLGVVIIRLFRGRAAESGILLAWIGVSVLLMLRTSGSSLLAIDTRYLSFLVPAAMIVIASGIDGVARGFEWAIQRRRRVTWTPIRHPAIAASVVLISLMLLQELPALAASYATPKNDWRGVAQHIAAASPPGSVVITLGESPDWPVICLDYYFHRLNSAIPVIDGRLVNSDVAAHLASKTSTVWGVVNFPSPEQQALLERPSDVRTDFVDVTGHIYIVRPAASGLSALDQARTLLRWEAPVMPQFGALAKVLDVYSGNAELGPDLLPPLAAGAWSIPQEVAAGSDALTFTPSGTTGEVNATAQVEVQAGDIYAVSLEWRNADLDGSQKAYLIVFDKKANIVSIFPTGDGYACGKSDAWSRAYFAFYAPAGTNSVAVDLRVTGNGTAQFRNVVLARLPEAD